MNGPVETSAGPVSSRRFALPACPKCNDFIFAAAASEFVSKGHVRHMWLCESCGHEFSTSVKLPVRPPAVTVADAVAAV
jgi:ribosomal protein L37AE/L43A